LIDIGNLIRKYTKITGNIDQIIQVIHIVGVEHSDPYLRFKFIQQIPEIVIQNYLRMDSKIKISKLNSFQKLFEKLLHKAKSDKSDSIKIEAQNSLRAIVRALSSSQYESEMFTILDNLQP
jgi:hypothetical protein